MLDKDPLTWPSDAQSLIKTRELKNSANIFLLEGRLVLEIGETEQ